MSGTSENLVSLPLQNWNGWTAEAAASGTSILPIVRPAAGEGGEGRLCQVFDAVYPTASRNTTATPTNSYRLCRFPVNAKVQGVYIYTKGLDSNATATSTWDINVAFSNSTIDGTPAALRNLIPTSACDGATVAFSTYTAANILFGTWAVANSGAAKGFTDILYAGTVTAWLNTALTTGQGNYTPAAAVGAQGPQVPLFAFFGFSSFAAALPAQPGGMFDILAAESYTQSTIAAGEIVIKLQYVI